MIDGRAQKISNIMVACLAGLASFVFSLAVFLYIKDLDEQVAASVVAGAFCLLISYIAAERPNSDSAKSSKLLEERLMRVTEGDFISPAPDALRELNPDLATAVDSLFEEVRASIENAHALGMYDPVTSLPNRLHFRSEAESLLRENGDRKAAMMFVDLDRFKAVNDCLGHARGDQLLVMVANRLRVVVTAEMGESKMQRPLLARLAGDEFTLFFPQVDSVEQIEMVARRIALAVSEPFELDNHNIDIGASIGVSISPDHGQSIERLMRAADLAMYCAKGKGGGQHCLFSLELAAESDERADIEQALTDVVARGQLRLALQPQMNLESGESESVEALLRWQHPSEGERLPSTFIKIAEQTGMINEIGDWVIGHVASILGTWKERGIDRRMSFNVSPRQLDRIDFFSRLRQAFVEQDVPLSMIGMEISETAVMQCSDAELAELAALRTEGAVITLDDFGTGYSNIARLRALPVDRVKLDQSLIKDIEVNEQARVVAQAVINLVKGMECAVIAESVENEAQADLLRAMGCDSIQGYVYAGPMSEEEFARWDAKHGSHNRSAA